MLTGPGSQAGGRGPRGYTQICPSGWRILLLTGPWRALPRRAQWNYLGPDSEMEVPTLRGGGTLTGWRAGKSRAGPCRI